MAPPDFWSFLPCADAEGIGAPGVSRGLRPFDRARGVSPGVSPYTV